MAEFDPLMDAIYSWWHNLINQKQRGDRAQLRRCKSPEEAAFSPAFYDLLRSVRKAEKEKGTKTSLSRQKLGFLAAVLSGVDNHVSGKLGEQLAAGNVSKLRFRRLLEHKDHDQGFYETLYRLVRLTKKSLNVRKLSETVLFWGDRVRENLAFEYYSAPEISTAKK